MTFELQNRNAPFTFFNKILRDVNPAQLEEAILLLIELNVGVGGRLPVLFYVFTLLCFC